MKCFSLLLLLILALLSCKKEYSYEGGPSLPVKTGSVDVVDTVLGDTAFFYDITLDGKRELGILGQNAIALVGNSGDSVVRMYNVYFYNQTSSDPSLLFSKGGFLNHMPSDTSAVALNQRLVKELLPGSYSFTKDQKSVNGIVLERYDAADKRWSTLLGSGDQTGSSFQIIKSFNLDSAYSSTGITHHYYIRCKFNCMLYDAGGNKLTLTNGAFGTGIWL